MRATNKRFMIISLSKESWHFHKNIVIHCQGGRLHGTSQMICSQSSLMREDSCHGDITAWIHHCRLSFLSLAPWHQPLSKPSPRSLSPSLSLPPCLCLALAHATRARSGKPEARAEEVTRGGSQQQQHLSTYSRIYWCRS